ncbi:MAG: hypothetical protein N4A35_13005 [Flavobacteriales bacterium]|nr:hypothetical protein [Flavobacteriales bacterium]
MKYIYLMILIGGLGRMFAQTVGINTTGAVPATSAMLDVSATNKGLLIPRVDIADLSTAAPVASPVTSLLVYNTNGTTGEGYYYWDGTAWVQLIDATTTLDDHDWYEESTTIAPDAITDDIYTEGRVRISTPNYPPLKSERTSTGTSSLAGVIQVNQQTTADMVDGFGVRMDFTIEDNAGVQNEIAHVGAVRDGADNSGRLQFWTENGGVDGVKMAIDPDGDIGFGTTAPVGAFHFYRNGIGNHVLIENTGSAGGNSYLILKDDDSNPGAKSYGIKSGTDRMDVTLANDAGTSTVSVLETFLANGNIGMGVTNPLEKLDVNGDIYLRGDDMYFSHDAATDANNDYVRFDDINTLNFGGASIFSFHADRPRGEDWSTPTGSISFDGAYATGRIGMNTTNPQASLDIENGYAVSDRFWYRDYVVSNTNTAAVLDRDGNPLPTNFVGLLFCSVTSTNAFGTSYWMVKRWSNGTVSLERIASFGSTTSNTPEIYDDAGTIRIRLYNHPNDYTVRVRTEQLW